MKKKKFLAIIAIAAIIIVFLGFTFSIIESGKQSRSVFYVVTGSSMKVKNDAINFATSAKMRGGAGYLFPKNGKFYVALSCYEKREDANLIAKNLKNVEVIELTIEMDKNLKKAAAQRLGIEVSNELYEISVAFDSLKIDSNGVRKKLEKIKENLNSNYLKNGGVSIELSAVASYMSALDNLINLNEKHLSWNLKYQRIRLLNICKDIYNNN